jgi:glycosyltransferase involved in cell wall biosynthesis
VEHGAERQAQTHTCPRMRRTVIMQVVDTLEMGGAERVAVNLANKLPQDIFESHICVTRRSGPLADFVQPHVKRFDLNRQGTTDVCAIFRLATYLRKNKVSIVHAHGTSVFIGALAVSFSPGSKLIWHDHFGRFAVQKRPVLPFRLATRRASAVIAVNKQLAKWSIGALRCNPSKVWYVPNFVSEGAAVCGETGPTLAGTKGSRIVCVANLRPEKDHLTLVRAMKIVAESHSCATLSLVGSLADQNQVSQVRELIHQSGLDQRVGLLGGRSDVGAILRQCDLGVISSASEGMPLALLEYGIAGLPVVATRVGQIPEVLDNGRAGLLVSPRRPEEVAEALLQLLSSENFRCTLGAKLRNRVAEEYGEGKGIRRICGIYEKVLAAQSGRSTNLSRRGRRIPRYVPSIQEESAYTQ